MKKELINFLSYLHKRRFNYECVRHKLLRKCNQTTDRQSIDKLLKKLSYIENKRDDITTLIASLEWFNIKY